MTWLARISKWRIILGDDDDEGSDTWTPGNFECEFCTKMFMTTGGLLKHVQQVRMHYIYQSQPDQVETFLVTL